MTDYDLSYKPSRTVTANVVLDDQKLAADLRASAKGKGWKMDAAITVTKYLAAGATGVAATLAIQYCW